MINNLTTSTKFAIGDALLENIQERRFCIVGCGGVGSLFAEMLVRTGATNISLIDGDKVELKNLNRTPFILSDIGEYKVIALKDRLKSINNEIHVKAIDRHFGIEIEGDKDRQEVRDIVKNSDITLIAVDENKTRIECEKLLNTYSRKYLVIGVEVNEGISRYAFGWMTRTPDNEKELKGYGENNGSYMSIVSEAVSAGFTFMMYHINNEDNNDHIERSKIMGKKYKNYFPI